MKKVVSIFSLVVSVLVFWWISQYTQSEFDYQIAQYWGYLFYWTTTVFLVSIPASLLNEENYKSWLYSSGVYWIASLFFAYRAGGGSGMILSFDGKLLTLILAGVYAVISVIYFIIQFVKNRR